MCGIVGYVGGNPAQDILEAGLRRLEYRGYDSVGVVTLNKDEATLLRAKGKVAELDALIMKKKRSDTIGIGHTRWATHGAPSERNAHPHKAGPLYVVHNGIIENYKNLKKQLEKQGATFVSDTDTEVCAKLIESHYDGHNLKEALVMALKQVVGAYGIAVVTEKEPDVIIVARQGSPLIVGVSDEETFIASDPSALVGFAEHILYLKDGEVALCRRGSVELSDMMLARLEPELEKLELEIEAIQKNGYDHFLLKEIFEQPQSVAATLTGRLMVKKKRVHLGGLNMTSAELREVQHILIIGCGTTYYAGMLAGYLFERIGADVHITNAIASEFRYRSATLPSKTIALIVSQSGETADTLACLKELKERGIRCLGVVNAVGSTIAREVDGGIYLHIGAEISVASTKAFTSQVIAMVLFGLMVAQAKGGSSQQIAAMIDELVRLSGEMEKALKLSDNIRTYAQERAQKEHALYLGRNTLYPVALEGALKMKEISYIHAEAYPAGELKHGPIALIDERFFEVFLLGDDWLKEKSESNLAEIRARGGDVLVIKTSGESDKGTLVVPTSLKLLAPLVMNVVLQLLSYHMAVLKGTDVDQPRNLAKSVTVE